MEIADLIDQARKAAGVESDSAFSKYLGLSRTAVGNWRSGVSLPDTVSCERLAGLTGQPLAKVIGMVGEARAHSREEKAVWRKLAASAALLALVVAPALFQQAHAATLQEVQAGTDPATLAAAGAVGLGIMRKEPWYRRALAWFMRNPPSAHREAFAWA